MEGAVDVRTENDVLIDSRPIRLAWLPKQSEEPAHEARLDSKEAMQPVAIPSLDPEEIATLMRRGEEYLKTGDIAAARLMLRRAANAGHPQAALALGATFDPVVLAELGVLGFAPDPAQARSWYDKAARLGLDEAQRRIERLARAGDSAP
jgi:TPR repeat protein